MGSKEISKSIIHVTVPTIVSLCLVSKLGCENNRSKLQCGVILQNLQPRGLDSQRRQS